MAKRMLRKPLETNPANIENNERPTKLIKDLRQDNYLKDFEEEITVPEKIKRVRESLPIFDKKEVILDAIRGNQVVLIKGETGCGKTTQVPQYILEDRINHGNGSMTNILVTQPRRISAVSMANRVAEERGEKMGQNNGPQSVSVGYEIRFESQKARDVASITFCTTGIVFQKLRTNPELLDVSHIILDEVHERDLHTDVLLGVLRHITRQRTRSLKIIIMSASLNIEMFQKYLDCPVIEVSGRTFSVESLYLEEFINKNPPTVSGSSMFDLSRMMNGLLGEQNEYAKRYGSITGDRIFRFELQEEINVSFITKLVRDIHLDYDKGMQDKGAILVFLPGWDTISAIHYNLTSETLNDYRDNPNYEEDLTVFCLHSQVDMNKQVKVFRPAEPGKRKVILSTNIAETSVTIEDVCYVIDCGKINVLRYFPLQKASNLNMEWISKSNGQQRAGRAGRVQEGICWHLYSRLREESLKKYMDPDIKRQQLEEVVLNIKSLQINIPKVEDFLTLLVEPPFRTYVQDAVDLLEQIGGLTPKDQSLTPLGTNLALIPLHPQLGKMVLMGVFFRCLDPILSIVSVLNEKDPFVLKKHNKKHELDSIRAKFANGEPSDHLMFVNVIHQWEEAFESGTSQQFCRKNYLNEKVLDGIYKIKQQVKERLDKMGILGNPTDLEQNSTNFRLIKAILAYAFYPLVKPRGIDSKSRFTFLNEGNGKRIYINQKSVNAGKMLVEPWITYFVARGNKKGNLNAHDSTALDEKLFNAFKFSDLKNDVDQYVNGCLTKSLKPSAKQSAVIKVITRIR